MPLRHYSVQLFVLRALYILTQAPSVLGEVEADFSAAGGRTIVDDAIEYARCSKRPAKIMEAVRCVRVRSHAAADAIVRQNCSGVWSDAATRAHFDHADGAQ